MNLDFINSSPFYRAVYDRGLQRGLAPHQIAGLLGNFKQESNGRSDMLQKGGNGIGGAQWDDRGPMLKQFAAQRGVDWRDPNLQADFVYHEMDGPEKRAYQKLLQARNVDEAVAAGLAYERPAGFNDPAHWASHPTLGYNNRLQGARMALGEASGPPDPTAPMTQAIGASGGAPSQSPLQSVLLGGPTSGDSEGWQTAGNIGDGLIGAGAAIMAIDNPSGASAIASLKRGNKKGNQWSYKGMSPNGAGVVMEGPNGELRIDPLPAGYTKADALEDTTSQKDYKFWQGLPPGPAKDGFGKARGFVEDKEEAPALNPDGLSSATEIYVRTGGKAGITGLSKADKTAVMNNVGQWAKEHDMTIGDVIANGPKMAGYMAQERDMGVRYNRMATAKTEMDSTLKTLEANADKVPKDLLNGSVPWNAFMQKTAEVWNKEGRPELAAYRETIQNVSNAYATLLARGATNVPVAMQNRAAELFNSNMSPDTIKALTSTMRDTSDRMMQGIKWSQENLRAEIAGKAVPHPNLEQEIETYIEERHKARNPQQQAPAGGAPQEAPKQTNPDNRQKAMEELRRRGLIK